MKDSTDEIPGVITQEQYVIIEQIPEETEQSEIMETANQVICTVWCNKVLILWYDAGQILL